jgi:hypothetical protein
MPRHLIDQTNCIRKIIENKKVRIKIEGKDSPFHQLPITKTYKVFFCMDNLTDSIHTNQLVRSHSHLSKATGTSW